MSKDFIESCDLNDNADEDAIPENQLIPASWSR